MMAMKVVRNRRAQERTSEIGSNPGRKRPEAGRQTHFTLWGAAQGWAGLPGRWPMSWYPGDRRTQEVKDE